MDVVDGLVRQRATPAAPVLEEFAIQVVDMFDAQRTFRDVADAWVDVVVDHPPVAMRGARTELRASTWHPLLGQELAECQRRRRHVGRRERLGRECGCDRFGVRSRPPGRMPAATLATAERVNAVVGDDVETGVAFNDVGHASVIGT